MALILKKNLLTHGGIRMNIDHLVKTVPDPRVLSQSGDIQEGRRLSRHLFEETYRIGYLAHAPIETHTALAKLENGRVTVWSTTQAPFMLKDSVAQTMGMSPENVRIITSFVGGGFGGKVSNPEALEAARLARLTGKPVQVCFSRAEEFFYDTFAPAACTQVAFGANHDAVIATPVRWSLSWRGAGAGYSLRTNLWALTFDFSCFFRSHPWRGVPVTLYVVPIDRYRRHSLAGRKFIPDGEIIRESECRIGVFLHTFNTDQACRTQLQRPISRSQDVDSPIADQA